MNSNLKKLRNKAGLSLQKLGDMCGRSKAQIHQLEKNPSSPTLKTAYLLAKVLDVSVYEIWIDDTEISEEIIVVRRVK